VIAVVVEIVAEGVEEVAVVTVVVVVVEVAKLVALAVENLDLLGFDVVAKIVVHVFVVEQN